MAASHATQLTATRKAVILTALPIEFQAVRAHLTGSREEIHSAGTVYERGFFHAESGSWEVLLVETGAGNSRAALEVERAIQYFAPEVALFVGVAGGLKDVTIGDVVFVSRVYGYESGKASVEFEPRGDTAESSYALYQRARAVARNATWLDRLAQPTKGRQPRVWPGPIAAGEKVIAETRSPEYQFLRQQYGDALAVEMEGRGFLTATWANRRVEALVIRGISDLIDRKTEADAQGSQELASKHASAFAFEVLAKFALPVPKSEPVPLRHGEQARVWMVPYSRNPNFTGRGPLLEAIRIHFLANPLRPRPLALSGLGGVGKTQLAVEYASQHTLDERNYSYVFWLRSDEPSVLASTFAELSLELDLPEKAESDQHLKVRAVQQWLQWNEGWLLVFDNAEEPRVVRPYLPPAHRGHVLITSRNAIWGELATSLSIQVLERAESIEFLRKRTGQDDFQAATVLAGMLGDLPLALAQAGAYIEQKGKSLAGYLALFEQRRQELLARPAAPTDYPHTVAATWDLSLEQVRTQHPGAVDLLSLCAFLAPSPFPTILLTEGAEALPSPLSAILADELQLDEALGMLRRYSLVQTSQDNLLLHPLVQTVMLSRLGENRGIWAEAALRFMHRLSSLVMDASETSVRGTALIPHALATAKHAWSNRRGLELLPELLARIGDFWGDLAEFDSAIHTFEWGLAITQELHGTGHVAEVDLLYGLASVELDFGRLKEAQEHTEKALDLVHAMPEKDPHRMRESSLFNLLALIFLRRGALREARECAEGALALRTPSQADGRSDDQIPSVTLGAVLSRQAQFTEALVHFESALKETEAKFGVSHPAVAAVSGNLAGVLERLGRLSEARDHLERSLKISETTYGPDHPRVATFLRSLGDLYLRLGALEKARNCCERALRIDESRLGPRHIDVASDLNNLARVHHELGDLQTARSYFERALAIDEHELGPQHIGLATILDNLGRVYEELTNLEQARTCFERSLAIYEQEHASDHPDIANVLNNLGHLLESMGDLPRARTCLERAVTIDETAYGPNHLEVAIDLGNLASVLLRQGERAQAEEVIRRTIAIHEEQGAADRSQLISCLVRLGSLYNDRREWNHAKPYLERALHEQESLNPHDPQCGELLALIGETLIHLGEDASAIAYMERARSFPTTKWYGQKLLRLLVYHGGALRHLGRTQEALARLEDAEQLAAEVKGTSLRGLAFLELGRTHQQKGSLDKAKNYIEQALELDGAEEEEWFIKAIYDLGRVLEDAQDLRGARARYEQALELSEVRHGSESAQVATICQSLGHVLLELREPSMALAPLNRALALYEQILGPEAPVSRTVRRQLGDVFMTLGDLQGVQACIEHLLEHQAAVSEEPLSVRGMDLLTLALVRMQQGKRDSALEHIEQVLILCRDTPEPTELLLRALLLRGRILVDQASWSEARAILEQVLQHKAAETLPATVLLELHNGLGISLLQLGYPKQALRHQEKALTLVTKLVGMEHLRYAVIQFNIAATLRALGKEREAVKRLKRAQALLEGQDPDHPLLRRILEDLERLSRQEG